LLDAVSRDGYVSGYRGVRIAKSGRRFWIEDGVVWQLIDAHGVYCGQAAMFAAWRDVLPSIHHFHVRTPRLLQQAGSPVDSTMLPTGNDALDAVVREWFATDRSSSGR
jgi:hypothetical protein